MKSVAIIVPCFNEEEALPIFINEANRILSQDQDHTYKILFVDDGSSDTTLKIIKEICNQQSNILYISLSKNEGQRAALLAGIENIEADYYVCMDVDLQDPLETVIEMAKKLDQNYDIAVGVRKSRNEDTFFKKKTATKFYKTVNKLEGKDVFIENANTFRMFTHNIKKEILKNAGSDFNLLHKLNEIGYSQVEIYYKRPARSAGITKYSVSKLFRYALDVISCSTTRPLYVSTKLSIGLITTGSIGFVMFLVLTILASIPSLPLINCLVIFATFLVIFSLILLAGVILIPISILSVYQSNILVNTRNNPVYHIKETNIKKE